MIIAGLTLQVVIVAVVLFSNFSNLASFVTVILLLIFS